MIKWFGYAGGRMINCWELGSRRNEQLAWSSRTLLNSVGPNFNQHITVHNRGKHFSQGGKRNLFQVFFLIMSRTLAVFVHFRIYLLLWGEFPVGLGEKNVSEAKKLNSEDPSSRAASFHISSRELKRQLPACPNIDLPLKKYSKAGLTIRNKFIPSAKIKSLLMKTILWQSSLSIILFPIHLYCIVQYVHIHLWAAAPKQGNWSERETITETKGWNNNNIATENFCSNAVVRALERQGSNN